MSIKVVRINKARNNFTTYIGRAWAGLVESIFHNPFRIGRDGTRAEVIVKFAEYWYAPEQEALRKTALIMIQDDDILGCYCAPLRCHGDIIAGYLEWKRMEPTLF